MFAAHSFDMFATSLRDCHFDSRSVIRGRGVQSLNTNTLTTTELAAATLRASCPPEELETEATTQAHTEIADDNENATETETHNRASSSLPQPAQELSRPPPVHITPHIANRRTSPTLSIPPTDTRRHAILVPSDPDTLLDDPETDTDTLPAYSPLLYTPHTHFTSTGNLDTPIDALTIAGRRSRARELDSLGAQWRARRRRRRRTSSFRGVSAGDEGQGAMEIEREETWFRAEVSRVYDLPPPYAVRDPWPVLAEERGWVLWRGLVGWVGRVGRVRVWKGGQGRRDSVMGANGMVECSG